MTIFAPVTSRTVRAGPGGFTGAAGDGGWVFGVRDGAVVRARPAALLGLGVTPVFGGGGVAAVSLAVDGQRRRLAVCTTSAHGSGVLVWVGLSVEEVLPVVRGSAIAGVNCATSPYAVNPVDGQVHIVAVARPQQGPSSGACWAVIRASGAPANATEYIAGGMLDLDWVTLGSCERVPGNASVSTAPVDLLFSATGDLYTLSAASSNDSSAVITVYPIGAPPVDLLLSGASAAAGTAAAAPPTIPTIPAMAPHAPNPNSTNPNTSTTTVPGSVLLNLSPARAQGGDRIAVDRPESATLYVLYSNGTRLRSVALLPSGRSQDLSGEVAPGSRSLGVARSCASPRDFFLVTGIGVPFAWLMILGLFVVARRRCCCLVSPPHSRKSAASDTFYDSVNIAEEGKASALLEGARGAGNYKNFSRVGASSRKVLLALQRTQFSTLEQLGMRVDRLYRGSVARDDLLGARLSARDRRRSSAPAPLPLDSPGPALQSVVPTAQRPLFWAAYFGNAETVKWLVEIQGADPNFFIPVHPDHWEHEVEHGTCFRSKVKPRCLIEDFRWATWRPGDGPKAILTAMAKGAVDMARLLLSLGATFRLCEVPWESLVRRRDTDALHFALANCRENRGQPRERWDAPYVEAAVAELAVYAGSAPGNPMLQAAVADVGFLLDAVPLRRIALHTATLPRAALAVLFDHAVDVTAQLFAAAVAGNAELVAQILEGGSYDINAPVAADGDTCLHAAARGSDPAIVRLLLDNGALPSAKNAAGRRPVNICTNAAVKLVIEEATAKGNQTGGTLKLAGHGPRHSITTSSECLACGGKGEVALVMSVLPSATPKATQRCEACQGSGFIYTEHQADAMPLSPSRNKQKTARRRLEQELGDAK